MATTIAPSSTPGNQRTTPLRFRYTLLFFKGAVRLKAREYTEWVGIFLVKFVPVLGTIVLIGAIFQVVLGFQVAADIQGLRDIHMGIGIFGLVLVVALAVLAFRAKTGIVYSKVTMMILMIIVVLQVFLGFQLLQGADVLLKSHEAPAFVIVLLSLLTGGMTFWSGTRLTRTHTSNT